MKILSIKNVNDFLVVLDDFLVVLDILNLEKT